VSSGPRIPHPDVLVTLSVLDRLIDPEARKRKRARRFAHLPDPVLPPDPDRDLGADDPNVEARKHKIELQRSRSQSVLELRTAVRRDLEWLLNCRRIVIAPDEGLVELNKSVYVFGIPDFAGWSVNSPKDQIRLLRTLQTTIKLFEPRLLSVNVVPIESKVLTTRTLRFRIEAMLMMDPAPEHISFDTVLDLTSSQYRVQGEGNAG
jgi:type VI secretion system protein ImpF